MTSPPLNGRCASTLLPDTNSGLKEQKPKNQNGRWSCIGLARVARQMKDRKDKDMA
ncbi:hypothetical protein IAD21_04878 [Abditibacteriota bacterium]|nr:hypothetical protein IAD21_04878 [Abditibacteriota bacterium]